MLTRWKQDKFTLVLLTITAVFVLLSLGLYYNRTSAQGAYDETSRTMDENRRIINRARATDLDDLRVQLQQTRTELETTTFPAPQKAKDIPALFTLWVHDSRIQLRGLSSSRRQEKLAQGTYSTYNYELRISGSLSQIQSFLGRFESDGPPTLVVSTVVAELKESTWEATINSTLYTQQE